MGTTQTDYVLGTDEAELARLGLQHRVWRESMLRAWRRAGLTVGWRVVDVGAGPGYATLDLAEVVGSTGAVLAVERSENFRGSLSKERDRRGLDQIEILGVDLMESAPPGGYDMTWCRWVASFVSSVPRLVQWISGALRPGGRAVFHEYVDYASWRFAPPRPQLQAFVTEVMASWREAGGEPDVAPELIGALADQGLSVLEVRPLAFATRPTELTWQWPARFVATNARRLLELGRVTPEWVRSVVAELEQAEANPHSVMVTPLVLEVIAERQ